MQDFKKLLDYYFREDTRDLPETVEDYKKRLEEPIRCLTELEFGKIYDTNVRGVVARNGMQLDDIKIYAADGEIIFYFSKLQPNFINKMGKPTRVPYKVTAEDVWIYRTSEMIDELINEFKRKKAGEISTPKSTAATAGTSTPKSAVASTAGSTPKTQSAGATPNTQSAAATPKTQSAAATPKTGSLAPTPTTQSAATTPRLGPAAPPPSPNSMKL
jgi:hypothetical protein